MVPTYEQSQEQGHVNAAGEIEGIAACLLMAGAYAERLTFETDLSEDEEAHKQAMLSLFACFANYAGKPS